ncbi:MAG: murein DD-endopeptidase MepM/ murein hydrolase activator NlpD [Methylophilaceae bacterium]|jgi:murein DD-endopeptidase MepM/ murein hydrolase activator NlpD
MNIILISNNLAKPRTLSGFHVMALLVAFVALSSLITVVLISEKNNIKRKVVEVMSPAQLEKSINSSQMHLDAYAKQIGELQARIMRLDAQNKRLVKLAGVETDKKVAKKAKDIDLKSIDTFSALGVGGPLVNPTPITEPDLKAAIAELATAVGHRDEYMNFVEADVLQSSVLKEMLPNVNPVASAYHSSSYGWRIDPIRGSKAFHEGLDFPAPSGTKIFAAGDGIVTSSERTHDYGNLVKVNHGSGLETRYAHASKRLVKNGDRVFKGQVIALVGSTGRSTGPHLHYEIRLNGSALDPRKYIRN